MKALLAAMPSLQELHSKQLWLTLRRAIGLLAIVLCAVFFGEDFNVIFQFHPILNSVTLLLLLPEALCAIAAAKKLREAGEERSKLIKRHRILGILSGACTGVAFVSVYLNIDIQDGEHFDGWHGMAGLASAALLCLQALSGMMMHFRLGIRSISAVALVKRIHSVGAFFLSHLCPVAFLLGMATNEGAAAIINPFLHICVSFLPLVLIAGASIVQ